MATISKSADTMSCMMARRSDGIHRIARIEGTAISTPDRVFVVNLEQSPEFRDHAPGQARVHVSVTGRASQRLELRDMSAALELGARFVGGIVSLPV